MLNKKNPYGEVHGHAPYQYMQDNKFFDGQGNEVDESGAPITETPKEEVIDDSRTALVKQIEEMTVDAIKLKLDAYEVVYDKKSVKADLVAMLVDEESAE